MRASSAALVLAIPTTTALLADTNSDLLAEANTAAIAYDADLFNKNKRAFFATGEFLYWLVNESALEYAIKMDQQPWSQSEKTCAIGNYQNAAFHWAPGARVSFGYFNAPHYWDFVSQYTYLRSSGSQHVEAASQVGAYLNGTWVQPDLGATPLAQASSHIDLNYNLLDFFCSRRFSPNEHLRLNLFGGVTAAFIHQHWRVGYRDIDNRSSSIRNHWRFDGLGLRAGSKIDWYMGCDLYLTALASNAILSGWYKNTAYQISSLSQPRPIRDSTYEDHRLTYTAQMMLGLSWQKRFNSVRTEAVAGYEFTVWTHLHEVYRSTLASPSAAQVPFINTSSVTLQGLTVRLTVDF
jgi:hypothetical protein